MRKYAAIAIAASMFALATAGEKQAETDGKQPDRPRKPKARAKKDTRS